MIASLVGLDCMVLLVLGGFGVVLLGAAALLRGKSIASNPISRPVATAALAVMLGLGGWAGAAVLWPEREPMAPARPPLPPGDYPAAILDIGAEAPPFEAEGWLNGSPLAPGESGQVIVVDLLALW